MRQQDVDELEAGGYEPSCLYDCVKVSQPHCFTIYVDGFPSALFGASVDPRSGVGIPWMLGCDTLKTIPSDLVRQGRVWVQYLSSIYSVMRNYVDDRNTVAKLWLVVVGFTLLDEGYTTESGVFFRSFELCANQSP